MTTTALLSVHGAPGATSLALGLAARSCAGGRPSLLLEADPAGGVLAARFDLELSPVLTDLAAAARRTLEHDEVLRFSQSAGPGIPVVVAHPSAEQTSAALRTSATAIGAALRAIDLNVFVDCGRWQPDSPAMGLVHAAQRIVVVMRPTLEQVVQVLHLSDWFPDNARIGVVLEIGRAHV